MATALGAPDDFEPFEPGSYVFLTAVGVLAGAIGWVVVLSCGPDFSLFEEVELPEWWRCW
ncbi:hypothetical protein [Streptomyces ferrugineus]|uniref:hypothetical protein n=1 Tax=Streptomyces ferrugineus TaxID=1413221 RepID=UPI001D13BDE4|nr:hypothetical protein [Streptomyces ferrugineus]